MRVSGPITLGSSAACATAMFERFGPITRVDGQIVLGEAAVFQRGAPNPRLQEVSRLTQGANIHVWADSTTFDRGRVSAPDGIDTANFEQFIRETIVFGAGVRQTGDESFSVFVVAPSSDAGVAAGEATARRARELGLRALRQVSHSATGRQGEMGVAARFLEHIEIAAVEQPSHLSVTLETDASGLGMMAAILVPAFENYVARAKTSEAAAHVQLLLRRVNEYYLRYGHLPDPTGPLPATPTDQRQAVDWTSDVVFSQLGFAPAEPVYYSYSIVPSTTAVQARGDLDGDGVQSLFEMSIGLCVPETGCVMSEAIYVEDALE